MTVTTIENAHRPDTEIKWYRWPDESIPYIKENYQDNGKMLTWKTEFSEDNLTRIRTSTWTDQGWDDWLADPTINGYLVNKRQYDADNNITSKVEIIKS